MKIYKAKDGGMIIVIDKGISTIYYAGWKDQVIMEDKLHEDYELIYEGSNDD